MRHENRQFEYDGKQINLALSKRAIRQLQQREESLHVNMELLFSCLLRKRVLFSDERPSEADTSLGDVDKLALYFTPRMTKACHVSDLYGPPDSAAFPLQHTRRFLPGWLEIEYHPRDGWKGAFGYAGGH
ncbi:hypothetical protein [Solemya elarraichensis gill symbiont]|uniref:Uncharacterized protein n=1 Tax=Solemya elarraichensis gill symbiont TaxID=1918949 RepID=A0A1T2LD67_9GAMM|nr:hypothetical protein [Solemya elarraichensis gill symbiont]OOZ43021.1 hypothetical protein BOW52_00560 [Solemya elarraichensis gill symbiont]